MEMASRLRLSATRLARQLRKESSTGLTPSQVSALATVQRCGSLTLGELAAHERVAPPSITRVVAKLEDDGLLERTPDANDRRVGRISLTPDGLELLDESRLRRNEWLASRIDTLDPEQRAQLHAALDVLDALAVSPSVLPETIASDKGSSTSRGSSTTRRISNSPAPSPRATGGTRRRRAGT